MELSMVKLKVQSAEDIVAAYLTCLGLKKSDAPQVLSFYPQLAESGNIMAELDDIIYQKAKSIYKLKMAKIQLVAVYKAAFADIGAAKEYGAEALLPEFDDKNFAAAMRQAYIEAAPSYKLTEMPTQKIETIQLHKHKSKGEKK